MWAEYKTRCKVYKHDRLTTVPFKPLLKQKRSLSLRKLIVFWQKLLILFKLGF